MSRRPYIGPSEAQSNAEALARRSSPYTLPHETSVRLAWGGTRDPDNLREAVRRVRRMYADEVPDRLHEAALGDDGTPRMTARAVGYIMGDHRGDDAGTDPETGQRDLLGYYHAPFRAALANLEHGSESERKRAAIVSHITIGSQGPREAAIAEGVPSWCAKDVAELVLRGFLRSVSDVRVHAPQGETAA